jgi:hypothetical protein
VQSTNSTPNQKDDVILSETTNGSEAEGPAVAFVVAVHTSHSSLTLSLYFPMPSNYTPAPQQPPKGKDSFDKLPFQLRGFLLLCLTVPTTVFAFWRGTVCLHTGQADASSGGQSTDFGEYFVASAFAAFISACLFAVMMGWLKHPKPDSSKTQDAKE